jgi:hypothetical protein
MSEDIEELVNNLNSSLTYAIKTTLGPYVQKLNMNNEKYKVVTNILKSLPEYKEMEKDILQFNSEKQNLLDQFNNEKQNLLHQFNSEKQNLLDQFHNEKQTLLQRLHEVITHNLSLQKEIDTKNASNEKINVGLNVIEKESPADEVVDVVDKVKDIYSQANIKVINNIVAPVPALRVVPTAPVPVPAPAISRDAEIEELISVLEKHLEKEEDASEVDEDASEVEEDASEVDEDEEASEVEEAEQKKVVIVTSAAAVVVDEDEEASEVEEAEQKKVVIVTSAADEEEASAADEEEASEAEDEVVEDEDEEEEELFAINIVGFKNEFYTSDKLNGDIYEVNSDDSVGKMLGKFKNGTPVWNK